MRAHEDEYCKNPKTITPFVEAKAFSEIKLNTTKNTIIIFLRLQVILLVLARKNNIKK